MYLDERRVPIYTIYNPKIYGYNISHDDEKKIFVPTQCFFKLFLSIKNNCN